MICSRLWKLWSGNTLSLSSSAHIFWLQCVVSKLETGLKPKLIATTERKMWRHESRQNNVFRRQAKEKINYRLFSLPASRYLWFCSFTSLSVYVESFFRFCFFFVLFLWFFNFSLDLVAWSGWPVVALVTLMVGWLFIFIVGWFFVNVIGSPVMHLDEWNVYRCA